MNKNQILTAVALSLSLSWLGCNKSGKLSEASHFATPTGPVELKLKWTVGEKIVQRMDMKQNIEINMPTQPEPMKQNMAMGQDYSLNVLQDTPDGGHEIEMEFLGARMKMVMAGKTMMEFDSAKKTSDAKPDPLTDVYGKIVGAKIQYFLDASNEVTRLEGMDALIDRVSSGSGAAAAAPLKSMFNEGYFKQMMSQNRYLPHKPVQPGDTWPVQIEFPMGPLGTLEMDFTFTLHSWEMHETRNCARMDFQGTLKSKPDAASKSPMSITSLDGSSSGTSWFDPELGIIIDTAMNQDIDMVMSMPMGGSTQSMTNHMVQDMDIKLVSVK